MDAIKQKISLLHDKLKILDENLNNCMLCPRKCRVNRSKGEAGRCRAPNACVVYSSFLHHGEEPFISGEGGSGTVFFSGCSLNCIYCQNYKFSHTLSGKTLTDSQLAQNFINLQQKGAHNINLVTPTHFLPQIFKALILAFSDGLTIPIVYNTSGYESIEILKLLEGIIDIYLADARYSQNHLAKELSLAEDYPQINRDALIEMHRQAGKARINEGIMQRGIIVRHLILPNCIDNSLTILKWIKENLEFTYISIMAQYQPYQKALSNKKINRKINKDEYERVGKFIEELDIKRGWFQDFESDEDMAGVYFDRSLE